VHRLIQHRVVDDGRVSERARGLLTAGEWVSAADPLAIVEAAVEAWRALRARPEVVSLLEAGRPHYEVPFSLHEPESRTILRGTIDCLVQKADGGVTVVEFKTGARRAVHESQLSIYVRAAANLFPSSEVEGRLIYP
jgi:ATP-dependent exoDNAse (exonuclease V) beta subunit